MAVRIAGVTIPNEKRIEIALTYVYGIGRATAVKILAVANIDPNTRVKDLSEDEIIALRNIIDKEYKVEGDLRREVASNIKRLIEINSYRGMRHTKKLPARGQRTKTNSRTVRGRAKRSVGSGKRPPAQKT